MSISEWIIEYRSILSVLAAVITILGAFFGVVRNLQQLIRFFRTLTQVIRDGFEKLRSSKKLETFWQNFIEDSLVVVLPPEDIDDEIFGTQSWDYKGKDDFLEDLEYTFGKIDRTRIFADSLQQQDQNANIISVGGPIPNDVTAYLLDQPEIVYQFRQLDSGKISHEIAGRPYDDEEITFSPVYSKELGHVTQDYGIITFAENPYNHAYDIVSVCGGFGQGTYAGFHLLTDADVLDYFLEFDAEYFQVIYTVTIDGQGIPGQPYLVDHHPDSDVRKKTITQLYTG